MSSSLLTSSLSRPLIVGLSNTDSLKRIAQSEKGIKFVRALDGEEKDLLQKSFQEVCDEASRLSNSSSSELHWINCFVQNEFQLDFPLRDELHEFVNSIIAQVYHDWPVVHIISYGFIISPHGGKLDQQFHYDYTMTSSNLFIPLTKITPLNSTQFIRTPLTATYTDIQWLGTSEEIMEKEGKPLELVQLQVPPFSLLHMVPSTPHRGLANRDDYTRIMFFCTVDEVYYELGERALSTYDDAFDQSYVEYHVKDIDTAGRSSLSRRDGGYDDGERVMSSDDEYQANSNV